MPALTRPIATIDLDALASNYRSLRRRLEGPGGPGHHAAPAAMVKADAYGLGVGPVARRLVAEGCTRLFVARLDEGLAVQAALAQGVGPGRARALEAAAQIYVLDGVLPGTEDEMVSAGLIPVLNDQGQVERWGGVAAANERELAAVLHVDTGMTRLGMPPDEADRLADDQTLLDGLSVEIVMSHLASADVTGSDQPARQLERFRAIRRRLGRGLASLANSAGIFLGPEYHLDLVRPGIALYGGAPLPEAGISPMETVVTIETPVVQVQEVPSGTVVGYGATHRTEGPTRLATAAVGYADGIGRAAGRTRTVSVGGQRCPVVGRVSMDLISVDVSALEPDAVVPGTAVQVLGPDRLLEDVAAEAGTIANEILTQLGHRYRRCYLGDPRGQAGDPLGHSPQPHSH